MQKIALLAILSLALSSCAELATYTGSSGENDVALGEEDSTAPNEETDATVGEDLNTSSGEEASYGSIWACKDRFAYNGENILWLGESGLLDPGESGLLDLGHVKVFDKTFEAFVAMEGLKKRWNWGIGEDGFKYSLTLDASGDAAYYDFSMSKEGDAVKPSELYRCSKSDLKWFP
ncbi:MAG: hypothetical protein GDA55_03770 [Cellvibrionales bacterium]|nr:hypothetical protein [Cellvibrionales bacterium]